MGILDITMGIFRISYFLRNTKIAETLAILEFPLFFIHERAGIRTPDNLIKSQWA